MRGRQRHAVRVQPGAERVRAGDDASPAIISEKKIPTDSTWALFWTVWFMAPPAPRSRGGRLFITAARLGDANIPIEKPTANSTSASTRIGEVGRHQPQRHET